MLGGRVSATLVFVGLLEGAIGLLEGAAIGAEGTWFVVPGRRDVPVFVNPLNLDASWSVVEGDFGLDRPAQVNPYIVYGPGLPPRWGPVKHYFPGGGEPLGYGPLEGKPQPSKWRPPAPNPSFQRSWHTESDPLPASTDPPYPVNIDAYVGPWGPVGPTPNPNWPNKPGKPGPVGPKPPIRR